jgi:hypothetical protein
MNRGAIAVTIGILLGYVALMSIDPAYGLLYPRGGMVMLGISLALADAGIWVSGRVDLTARTRFQLAAAGWIWLIVQAGCLAYVYAQVDAGPPTPH